MRVVPAPAFPKRLRRSMAILVAVLLAAATVAIAGLYLQAQELVRVNPDAGYFLSLAERAADGVLPYRDIRVNYPPLVIHVLSLAALLRGGSAGFGTYLSVVYGTLLAAAGVVFLISWRLKPNGLVAWASALAFLISSYSVEGVYVVLEPFVVLFSLLAIYCCLRSGESRLPFLAAGACGALSFLSKQYGILVFLPVGLYVLMTGAGVRGLLAVAAGAALPVVLYGATMSVLGVSPWDLLQSWSGAGYPSWGFGRGWLVLRDFLFPGFPVLLAPLLAIGSIRRMATDPKMVLVVSSAAVFCVPLAVRSYLHYLILIAPFPALIAVRSLEFVPHRLGRAAAFLLFAGTLALLLDGARIQRQSYRVQWDRGVQEAVAASVGELVPPGSKTLVVGDSAQWLNYLCGFRPPAPREFGYTFTSVLPESERESVLGPTVVGTTEVLRAPPSWIPLLEAKGFVQLAVIGDLEVWATR